MFIVSLPWSGSAVNIDERGRSIVPHPLEQDIIYCPIFLNKLFKSTVTLITMCYQCGISNLMRTLEQFHISTVKI